MGELNKKIVRIEYGRPKMHRRFFAALIDLLLLAFGFIAMFLTTRQIVISTPHYREVDEAVIRTKLDSGLYVKVSTTDKIVDKMSYISQSKDITAYAKMDKAMKAIDQFFNFMEDKVEPKLHDEMVKSYDDYRLNENLKYDGVPYFVTETKVDEEGNEVTNIIRNKACSATNEIYFREVYAPFVDVNCQNYLIKFCPNYYENIKYISNMTLFVECPIALLLSGVLVYLVPPLIMKRGRLTIGKKIYNIGAVKSKDFYNVPVGRTIARWAVFFFGVVLLSFLTLGVPMF